MKFRRFLIALLFAFISANCVQFANADVVSLTFCGTYEIDAGKSIFGLATGNVAFSYRIDYDTDLDTDTTFRAAGSSIQGATLFHDLYGYSASGIVGHQLTIGNKTFVPSQLDSVNLGNGVDSDFYLDVDLASGQLPGRSALRFRDGLDELRLGEWTTNGIDFYMIGTSLLRDDSDTAFDPMDIKFATVPEPIGSGGLVLILFGASLQRKRK